ncbi:Xaa-Pro dipeptidyl-peptidase [Virgibacillus soli]|uniref:Xaa-Pro dipeptidyl-peptidase n=1 Tax=Paracerasibacillus soli TaxID=480284 RepID=A0ABU5CSH9_9BACI|nr:Xaa-Pro dipeptidyl-peptidase [Virgibacillus soli]MDY0409299.1 Xaa-Pro dipeptidyl-peptidase [Virgibacillus soli]
MKQRVFRGFFLPVITLLLLASPMLPTTMMEEPVEASSSFILENGVTQPIYSYEDAIKETIYVASSLDSDRDGETDRIAIDIMRPKETEGDLKVPVIMDASPYYESMGRGNEAEIKDPDGIGENTMFPLYYDNYFVPRGYAVVLVDMVGTNNSQGCPTTGGFEEIESVEVVIDWLNGRAKAWDKDGEEVAADWATGKVGMIGKSYDGTLANGAAARGIDGLETIVPIGAISSWYDYYRYGGIPFYRNGPGGLAGRVTSSERVADCAPVREEMRIQSDDETGNYNDFWDERNYVKDSDKVSTSVFVIHGLNDYNVKANHFSNWWEALAENDVPRKLWLTQTGHVDPFDFRRAEWVDTLHRWFDYWLLGIENGIMDEPTVDIERAADEWETYTSWPDAEADEVAVKLAPANETLPGTLHTGPVIHKEIQSFIDNPRQTEREMVEDEFTTKDNRLIFLTPELEEDIRLSGVPEMNLSALVDKDNTNLTALIVDYGTDVRVNHRSREEGIRTLEDITCWGESTPADNACYKETEKVTHEAPYEIVTHGWLDAQNWESLHYSNPLEPGKQYGFQWDMLPEDYVFKKGHRLGVIIVGSDPNWIMTDSNRAKIDVSLGESYIKLPIVGGKEAFNEAIGYDGGTSPKSTADLLAVVKYFLDEGAFENEDAARALDMHLAAIGHYERENEMNKVLKHLENFKVLLAYQKDQQLISSEAYHVLKVDTQYLIDLFE